MTHDGNLMKLLQLRTEEDPGLERWLKNQHYMSPEIVNKLIAVLGKELLQRLLENIRDTSWFAIIADETTDIAKLEQLSISIRWVRKTYEVNEDFVGLIHVPYITAATLTDAIKDVLIRCQLRLSQCRGQAYDGASNMMGRLRGVATQIQVTEAAVIPVHCLSHCLNLCLQDAARKCQPIRNALNIVMDICQLIKFSPKRSFVF